MKKILCIAAILSAVFLQAAENENSLDWKQTENPMYPMMERLDTGLNSMERSSFSVEQIKDRLLAKSPLFAWRIVYMRDLKSMPQALLPENNQESGLVNFENEPGFEYADLLLIPKSAPIFQIENALDLDTEGQKFGDELGQYFTKYGFTWRNLPHVYHYETCYLGENEDCYVFGSANLDVLIQIQELLGLKNGDLVPDQALAEALDVRDKGHFTAEYAKRELLKRKSISSLSSLKSEIEKLSSYGESTEDYFYILLDMNLAQADELICDLAVHTDSFILRESLFDAVVKRSVIENSIPAGFGRFNPEKDNQNYRYVPRESLKKVYRCMLLVQYKVPEAIHLLKQLPDENSTLQKDLSRIKEAPSSFYYYQLAVQNLFALEHPESKTVHWDAMESIVMVLLHNGDIPDTYNIVNFDESEASKNSRLQKEDIERQKSYEEAIIKAPETELSILSGIMLAMFDIKDGRVKRTYINRVNQSGEQILRALPKDQVHQVLDQLIYSNRNEVEKAALERLKIRCY